MNGFQTVETTIVVGMIVLAIFAGIVLYRWRGQ